MKYPHIEPIEQNRRNKQGIKGMLLVMILILTPTAIAQVTVGAGEPPEKAALLQLKDITSSQGGITASTGGLLLPRVELVNRRTLEPFIRIDDPEWENISTSGIGVKHAGLVVYNIYDSPEGESNPDKIFKRGEYVWNGSFWTTISDILSSNIEGLNGITCSYPSGKTRVELGGELQEEKSIDLKEHNLAFITQTGGTLRVEGESSETVVISSQPSLEVIGKFRLSPAPVYEGEQKRLVINEKGEVGIETTKNVISLMTYTQSPDVQEYSATSGTTTNFNNGTPIVVEWTEDDFVVNNIMVFDQSNNELEILNEGYYEVSGYVNYMPSSQGSYVALNAIIQYKLYGTGTWQELSLARKIFTGEAGRAITSTVVIPGAAVNLKKGDRIRMVLARPSGIGDSHGNFGSSTWGIKKPTGGKFSKGLKIEAI